VKIAAAMMVGHHANKDALHLRLRRIEGQVPGIQRMVEQEADCIEASHRSPRSPVP
jgi:DNA-binding FrmR family transcriptional regulator